MENILQKDLSEIIFSSSDIQVSKQISKLEKLGKIRKIAPRIYTSNFKDKAESIIKNNLFHIVGKLYPGAILSHRSALEYKPTSAGHIFITYSYTKKITLPGITLRFQEGPKPIKGDTQSFGDLYVSQQERALLENLQVSRQPGPESKTLTLPEIENQLEQVVRVKGEKGLNDLRDKAKKIASELNMKNEFEKLNKLISAILSTKPSKILTSPQARARALGAPYDPARITLFETLFQQLQQQQFKNRPEQNKSTESFKNFAFFEAYFSNYIEGTEFELDDAKQIIQTEMPMPSRDEDSHDVLGTYKLVSSRTEMKTTPSNAKELLEILQYRHAILLSSRTSKNPGQFKHKNNRAGETHFVDYTLTKGTLIKGFDYYQLLTAPFAKAVYMMFLVSEVHPFLDGNGRIARVMMNAELVKEKQSKIIIPTVFREDYMGALRQLTRQQKPSTYIKMLMKANDFSETIVGNMKTMEAVLEKSNAFKHHDEAKLKIVHFTS